MERWAEADNRTSLLTRIAAKPLLPEDGHPSPALDRADLLSQSLFSSFQYRTITCDLASAVSLWAF